MTRINLLLVSAAALAATGCETIPTEDVAVATTAEPPPRGHSKKGFVTRYDVDGDGEVKLEEFMAEREEGYHRRDADGDGAVYEEEYVAGYEVRLEEQLEEQHERQIKQAHVRFDVLDADDNAEMTLEEFHASSERMFSRLDTNEDGVVNEEDTADRF